jgi:PAS domain S-box-containing protein
MLNISPPRTTSPPPLLGYALAILLVGGTVAALAMVMSRWQAAAPVSMLLIAIIIATRFGGTKPGLLAIALAIPGLNYLLSQLHSPLLDWPMRLLRLASLTLIAGYVVWITASDRRRTEALARAREEEQRNNDALRAENLERRRTEAELRASEAKFRAVAESAPAAIFICQDDRITYSNPAATAISGFSSAELLGRSFWDTAVPESRESMWARAAARRTGQSVPARFELEILTKDGAKRRLDFTEGAFDLAGKPAVVGIALDVTERSQAEDAVRKSERVLREAEELGRTGSWEHDLSSGEIFNTPENLRLFFGDDRNKGARFEDYAEAVHPEDRAYVMARHQELVEEGGPRDIEYRVLWPDGTVHMLVGRAAVVRDASGRVVRVYGTNVDVTERKRAEEGMRETQQLLNLVLDTLPVGVAVMDQAGNLIMTNAASQRIWGEKMIYSGDERWVRSAGYRHDSGEKLAPAQWPSVRALRDGQVTSNELIDIDAFDGRRKTIQVSAAPIRSTAGPIAGAVIVIDEVTERVRAEEALHESAARLQHLSHRLLAVQEEERRHLSRELHDEFGQLLASVTLHLQAAKSTAGRAAQASLDESIALLQRAGVQVRSLALELRPMLLETAGLDATLRWLGEQYQQRTGTATQVVGHVPEVSGAVAIACFRVVQEALTNVVRHARAQHVWIEVSQSEGSLRLVVRDDGIGFDVESIRERAADAGNLGLIGMRERVEILGGRLTIDSEPGRGTRICVTLPVIESTQVPEQQRA